MTKKKATKKHTSAGYYFGDLSKESTPAGCFFLGFLSEDSAYDYDMYQRTVKKTP